MNTSVAPRVAQRMTADPGIRFGLANGLVVLVLCATGLTHQNLVNTTALVVLVAGVASTGLLWWQIGADALIAWALITGFAEHRYGDLTFAATDLCRLAIAVVAIPTLACLVGSQVTTTGRRR